MATHNANIVVNGDSENVIELRKGVLSENGAIDTPLVKRAITETMEGGKVAFELRRVKYNFDKIKNKKLVIMRGSFALVL